MNPLPVQESDLTFGENTNPQPFEILNARRAQHESSKLQRELADNLSEAHKALAHAEFLYRRALTERIKQLHGEGMAITTCENVAKGEESVALLRKERDERKGELAQVEQEGFRMGADRRALDGLVNWSMYRDLRVESEPVSWRDQPSFPSRAA